jgi:hypothetical protein
VPIVTVLWDYFRYGIRSPSPSPLGYDRGMSDARRNEPDAVDAILWGLIPMILFGICVVPPAGLAAAAIAIGPIAILRFVRWVNRRDDPRYAKLPPDQP